MAGAQNVERIVLRKAFDQGLLAQARTEGVTVLTGNIASMQPDESVIRMADGRRLLAGLLFDARGRRAPRKAYSDMNRAQLIGPESISISGFLDAPFLDQAGSHIEAHPEGWTWRARLSDGREWLQVVGDKRELRGGQSASQRLAGMWQHVVGASSAKAPLPSTFHVSAAGLRLNSPELDPRCPALGDAAVALDPLSGHGLFWAISSALMTPAMAQALLGGHADLAREFYRDRVVDTFWRQARIGRDFYASSGQDGVFWLSRRVWPDARPAHPPLARPRLEPRVLLCDGALCRGEVLVTERDPGGAAFVLGQAIAPILRAIGNRPLPERAVFHRTYLPSLPASTAAQLHGWLISRGLGQTPAVMN
nr:tryptophan 7-halogenase [Ruegeria marina]